jgi:hypothetical protein
VTYVLIVLGIVAVLWFVSYLRGNPRFWHVVADYPDEAYEWFTVHSEWVVLRPGQGEPYFPEGPSEYAGPFTVYVPKLGGARVKVYGLADRIEASQAAFLVSLRQRGKPIPG